MKAEYEEPYKSYWIGSKNMPTTENSPNSTTPTPAHHSEMWSKMKQSIQEAAKKKWNIVDE
ncbi:MULTISPECIES: hypothetical protein [Alkalihalophilus]|jgi:hypothetical protein|uniref:Uncharacterized protein n=3 Tax=Alkalihalophilus TaxID=2893060 RepID=D3FVK7_ALKPO|nr:MULTISPECIES: hypothetical protein [Alkalihalophilus]ADC48522.1 hypothetical protein BpOF4_02275 [Alkalihalophilus pseudofirmus OF4]ERN52715.1 hypothetical protein A33I_14905 [Alkalihalophilus marmarensis DSM 21297]MCM3488061.1 hypothetical protein [Alkalihalophilus marmarensis]MDV2885701.1 hypothetical protein [Alkalihalophilus pseudofirmus]MEC2071510.1 hypothetical protein [Alkalihalophilus marmarensis]